MGRILLVEDDTRTVQLLVELLTGSGHVVDAVGRAGDALPALRASAWDLVVLDVMLPDRDGFSVVAEIRAEASVPVLMLSARGGADDRVDGLLRGADDYLPKPFDPRELLARIDAILRRSRPHAGAVIRAGALAVDPARREARLRDIPVDLTAAEFDLLRVLVERAGRVVARERLMELARGQEWGAFDRSLDVHISHIRRKLGDDPRAPTWIRTVRGVGYLVAVVPETP